MLRVLDEVLLDRRTGWLNTRWFPGVVLTGLIAVLALLPALSPGAEAWGYDYRAFRAGAEMTLAGDLAEAYDPARFADHLGHPDKPMYWLYAPHGAMVMAPLGLGPWWLGGAALFALTAGAAYAAGRLVAGEHRHGVLATLGSLPVLFALLLGQAAPVFGALLVGALWLAPRRPTLAGLMLAALTIKPSLGLMAPVFLLARGQWRVIGSACAGTAGLVLASFALFGPAPWSAMLAQAGGPSADFLSENLYASMPTVQQYLRFAGVGAGAAGVGQALVILGGAILVWLTRALPYERHVALTLLTACAVLPYGWFYDWLPATAAVLILMRTRTPRVLLAAVWLAPFASLTQEAMLASTPAALALALTNTVNAAELAALWGLISALALPALRRAPRAGSPTRPATA